MCWSPYEEHSHDSPLATRVANEFIGTTAGLARAARTTSDLAGGPRRASRALNDFLHGHFDLGHPSTPGSLPYVVAEANANSNASEIEFDPTVFSAATPATITLTSTLELCETAFPEVIDATTPGVGTVTVDGMNSFGVIVVGSSTTADLEGLSVSDGSATYGGGIDNEGTLTLTDVTLSSNTATEGGAIYNGGRLTITGGTVSGNTATFIGGGICNAFGDVRIGGDCSIASNSGSYGGGVCQVGGAVTITGSTLKNNMAAYDGGGILVYGGSLTIGASTLSGNTAEDGGGIYNSGGDVKISDGCSIASNSA